MKRRFMWSRVVGSLAGLSAFALGASASASSSQTRNYTSSYTAGNNNFYASYVWNGSIRNDTQGGYAYNYESDAWQQFFVDTKVFGKYYRPMYVKAEGFAWHNRYTNPPYIKGQIGIVQIAGQTLYNANVWNQTCPGRTEQYGCSTYSRSLSKTLFSASGSFTVGFIPVTVNASVSGGITGGINIQTYSAKFLGLPDSFYGRGTSTITGDAYVSSHQSAAVGIPYVVEFGAAIDYKLIDVGIAPQMYAYQAGTWTSPNLVSATRGYSNNVNLDFSSMSGSVSLFIKALGQTIASTTLVSWSGYNRSGNLFTDAYSAKTTETW